MMGGTGPADAALDTFIRNLAVEIGPRGVRALGMWVAGVPETFTSERIAAVNSDLQLDDAVFLASDRAGAITGTFTNVTGMFPS